MLILIDSHMFKPTHILLDGSSFLYRAYYSTLDKNFINAHGEPIGAIMTFTNMLFSLRKKYKNIPMCVIFDAPGKCFRHELYPEYKANRKKMPEDLITQKEVIKNIVKAVGCNLIILQGVEADDVIGTYASQAIEENAFIVICSGDKDLYQLVNDHVVIEDTMNDIIYDEAFGFSKFGVKPNLMIDFLSLKGDSSDNIPGMPGVGDKTAQVLLNGIGNIYDIKNNLDKISQLSFRGSKNFAEKFLENWNTIELSYQLAKIKTDVDVPTFKNIQYEEPNYEELGNIFLDKGLKKLYEAIKPNISSKENETQKINITNYFKRKIITTENDFLDLINQIKKIKIFAINIDLCEQGTNYKKAKILAISLATEGISAYVPLNHSYIGVPDQIQQSFVINKITEIYNDPTIECASFNNKNNQHLLQIKNINNFSIHDIMLEAYVINSSFSNYNLDTLSSYYLSQNICTIEKIIGTGKNKSIPYEIDINQMSSFSIETVETIFNIHKKIYPLIKNNENLNKIYHEQFLPLSYVLFKMEKRGTYISITKLNELSSNFSQELKNIEKRIFELASHEFNIASPKQVGKILFEEQQMLPTNPILRKKIEKGDLSTNEEILTDLSELYEMPALILDYRAISKLKNTYSDVLPKLSINDRIHTTFNQIGTSTGRISSLEPNLQNIPIRSSYGRKIRTSFIAPKGYKIVAADYSQIELRILSHLSNDQNLISAFLSQEDIHKKTASEIFGIPIESVSDTERRNAKAINFGIVYGMSAFGLSKQIKTDQKTAKRYIENYFNRYPNLKSFLQKTIDDAKELGYVSTITGRKIFEPNIQSPNKMIAKNAERVVINAPMQGSAADIIELAMIKIMKFIDQECEKDSIFMVLQIHDELIFEIKEEFVDEYCIKIKEIMENVFQLSVPLKVNINSGDNWEQAH